MSDSTSYGNDGFGDSGSGFDRGSRDSSGSTPWKRWALLVIGGLSLLWVGISYNDLASQEEGLRASKNMVILAIDKMEKKITSQGYVVKDFKATLERILTKTIGEGGRSASGGSFITAVSEAYPGVPESVWRDLSATSNAEIESMISTQVRQVDRARALRSKLRNVFYFPAVKLGGYPTINIEEYETVIVGSKARSAQESGTLEIQNPLEESSRSDTPAESGK